MFHRNIAISRQGELSFCAALLSAVLLGAVLWLVPVKKWQNEDNAAGANAVSATLQSGYESDMPHEEHDRGEAEAFPDDAALPQQATIPMMPEIAYDVENSVNAPGTVTALSATETAFTNAAVIADMKLPEYAAGSGVESDSAELAVPEVSDEKNLIVQSPRLLSPLQPEYPLKALNRGIEGRVQIRFTVNEQGRAENFEILKAEPAGIFEDAAIKALKKARFEPARDKQGRPTGAILTLPVNFRLY